MSGKALKENQSWSQMQVAVRAQASNGGAVEEIAEFLQRSEDEVLSEAIELGITIPQNSK